MFYTILLFVCCIVIFLQTCLQSCVCHRNCTQRVSVLLNVSLATFLLFNIKHDWYCHSWVVDNNSIVNTIIIFDLYSILLWWIIFPDQQRNISTMCVDNWTFSFTKRTIYMPTWLHYPSKPSTIVILISYSVGESDILRSFLNAFLFCCKLEINIRKYLKHLRNVEN